MTLMPSSAATDRAGEFASLPSTRYAILVTVKYCRYSDAWWLGLKGTAMPAQQTPSRVVDMPKPLGSTIPTLAVGETPSWRNRKTMRETTANSPEYVSTCRLSDSRAGDDSR